MKLEAVGQRIRSILIDPYPLIGLQRLSRDKNAGHGCMSVISVSLYP